MPAAVKLREDYSAEQLRALAKRSKDANQSRRLLSLAAVRGGWIAARRPRSAAGTARPCATGFIASTRRVRTVSLTIGRAVRRRVFLPISLNYVEICWDHDDVLPEFPPDQQVRYARAGYCDFGHHDRSRAPKACFHNFFADMFRWRKMAAQVSAVCQTSRSSSPRASSAKRSPTSAQ